MVTKNMPTRVEESKVTDDDLHYFTIGPMTDYNQLLEDKGFEFSGENAKLQIKDMPDEPLPKMN